MHASAVSGACFVCEYSMQGRGDWSVLLHLCARLHELQACACVHFVRVCSPTQALQSKSFTAAAGGIAQQAMAAETNTTGHPLPQQQQQHHVPRLSFGTNRAEIDADAGVFVRV